MHYLYKITNTENKKVYIWQKERFLEQDYL